MDTSKLIGQSVKHVTYGSGKIAAIDDKYIQIIFDRGESKRFQFPQVFVSYLKIEDASLMSEILMEEQKRIMADQRKKELINIRVSEKPEEVNARGGLHDKKQKAEERVLPNNVKYRDNAEQGITWGRIINLKTYFSTHADVLNNCFGFHYKHYQKAYKDLENGYAVWFPRIARKAGDQYMSSDDYWGWLNILSDSGETITQMDNPDFPYTGEGGPDNNKRLIFARFDKDVGYRFIGVFVFKERIRNGESFMRIGTVFDTRSMTIIQS